MVEIGIFNLKTHLSQVVERVQEGEEFLVTNRGNPVAILTYPEEVKKRNRMKFFSQLRDLLKEVPLADDIDDLKSMIEEGRK